MSAIENSSSRSTRDDTSSLPDRDLILPELLPALPDNPSRFLTTTLIDRLLGIDVHRKLWNVHDLGSRVRIGRRLISYADFRGPSVRPYI
jgi:hypothetical protein